MQTVQTAVPDIVIFEPGVFEDDRGWFMEAFNERAFHEGLRRLDLPVPGRFVQDGHSCSRLGVLRGLHYQVSPHAQGKLVRVTAGAVFDVAVDLRRLSPTFGRWVGVDLSAENRRQLWIPEGFAHGFLALSDRTEFHYKLTDYYAPACERAIAWNDAQLGIRWPLPEGALPIVSAKDSRAVPFAALVGA